MVASTPSCPSCAAARAPATSATRTRGSQPHLDHRVRPKVPPYLESLARKAVRPVQQRQRVIAAARTPSMARGGASPARARTQTHRRLSRRNLSHALCCAAFVGEDTKRSTASKRFSSTSSFTIAVSTASFISVPGTGIARMTVRLSSNSVSMLSYTWPTCAAASSPPRPPRQRKDPRTMPRTADFCGALLSDCLSTTVTSSSSVGDTCAPSPTHREIGYTGLPPQKTAADTDKHTPTNTHHVVLEGSRRVSRDCRSVARFLRAHTRTDERRSPRPPHARPCLSLVDNAAQQRGGKIAGVEVAEPVRLDLGTHGLRGARVRARQPRRALFARTISSRGSISALEKNWNAGPISILRNCTRPASR